MMGDIFDNNSWVKSPAGGGWGYGSRYEFGWTDPRASFGVTQAGHYIRSNYRAFIECTGPERWQVFIRGEYVATAEAWDEAKALAALLLNVKEQE